LEGEYLNGVIWNGKRYDIDSKNKLVIKEYVNGNLKLE